MSEGARPADAADIGVLEALLAAAAREIEDQRGGATFLVAEGPALQPLREALDDHDAVLLVGTYDEVVFGVASMRVVTRSDGQLVGRIERLFVDAEARKSGIGEAMMNRLLDVCRDRGCTGIESIALPGDRHTKNFFESFGLKARMLTVMREL